MYKRQGLHVNEGNDIIYKQCNSIAENMPIYPEEGYIKETNDAIIVNFGHTSELGSYKCIEDLDCLLYTSQSRMAYAMLVVKL